MLGAVLLHLWSARSLQVHSLQSQDGTTMKRCCFSLSPAYSAHGAAAAAKPQQALLGTFLFAITIATALTGAIWFT
jgi:hypothetical protein